MAESWETRRFRWMFRFFPCYWGTGARVAYVASDWKEMRVELPLSVRTRNYVGTIFGGSIYGAVDPIYMLMLIKLLGPGYVVWDKAATIRFRKPGRSKLTAVFKISDEELASIRGALETERSIDRLYVVELVSEEGQVCATIDKTLYIRKTERRAEATAR
ncbi:MAG: DUF4442 domain-containing protein [Deltaproteobacteria bacterium]|nr:DUF4442 domain-containing protein [Deltaproteobacteria bacterium]